MAFQIYELARSRSTRVEIRAGEISFDYIALGGGGSTDDTDLLAYTLANTSADYGFWQRKNVQLDPQGGGVWNVKVTYAPSEGQMQPARDATSPTAPGTPAVPAEPGGNDPLGTEFSFDTTGGNQHITQSRYTVCRVMAGSPPRKRALFIEIVTGDNHVNGIFGDPDFLPGDVGCAIGREDPVDGFGVPGGATITAIDADGKGATLSVACTETTDTQVVITNALVTTPPDFKQAIGVSHDGVAGCDVIAPKLEFQIVKNFQYCTLNYIARLRTLTGSINNRKWYGFPPGELLFMGAQGQTAQNGIIRITYRFGGSPNESNIQVSPDLKVPVKGGWDYLWVSYKDDPDDPSKRLVTKPDAAYVERVYPLYDFRLLGI